jgi:hypothetical protein
MKMYEGLCKMLLVGEGHWQAGGLVKAAAEAVVKCKSGCSMQVLSSKQLFLSRQ